MVELNPELAREVVGFVLVAGDEYREFIEHKCSISG